MADVSLDEMLLEAAGRAKGGGGGGQGGGKKRRAPTHDSTSPDRSDSNPDYDEDDDEDEFGGGGSSGRKAKSSKMPLKKRFESSDKDEDNHGDGYESEFSYGSDLYKDDEDRDRLAAMTELEREMELAERGEKRDTWLALRKSRGARQAESSRPRERGHRDLGPPSSRMRSSVKESTRSKKESALHELVARRQRAQDPGLQQKRRDSGPVSRSKEAGSPQRRKARESVSYSNSESPSEEEEESDREEDERSDGGHSDDDGSGSDQDATEEEIAAITIRRTKLFKWFMEPFFEEIIVGCFVRIGIGVSNSGLPIYRLCQVKNVDAKDPDKNYKFQHRTTYKWLNCFWGDESKAARWQMVRASDQAPSPKEIQEYLQEADRLKARKPTKAHALEKKEAIMKVSQFVYSASAVKQMLQEKKMAAPRPANIALEKSRVLEALSDAVSRGDEAERERLESRLKELEVFATQVKTKDAKALALAEMNRRNRFENFKNASELKPVNVDAKAGEAGYDPFSRRWTRSQNYYQSDRPKTEKEATADDGGEKLAKGVTSEEASKLVNVQAPVDGRTKLFALHDFDLDISLEGLGNMKGPGGVHNAFMLAYMARKGQLEATCGVQVESNDGRRHSLTLTVNDYKRRRGLL
ncbi:hypothetical protein BDL97_11G006200 [Sphagnum fallax]|nr:hypothetical protein BDL97_11G006200 [Sphagnum fallax]